MVRVAKYRSDIILFEEARKSTGQWLNDTLIKIIVGHSQK